jgi:hypothetical protein
MISVEVGRPLLIAGMSSAAAHVASIAASAWQRAYADQLDEGSRKGGYSTLLDLCAEAASGSMLLATVASAVGISRFWPAAGTVVCSHVAADYDWLPALLLGLHRGPLARTRV